jgi:hypothetical protein
MVILQAWSRRKYEPAAVLVKHRLTASITDQFVGKGGRRTIPPL